MKEVRKDQAMRSKKSRGQKNPARSCNKRYNKRGFTKEEKCEERGRGRGRGGSRRWGGGSAREEQ